MRRTSSQLTQSFRVSALYRIDDVVVRTCLVHGGPAHLLRHSGGALPEGQGLRAEVLRLPDWPHLLQVGGEEAAVPVSPLLLLRLPEIFNARHRHHHALSDKCRKLLEYSPLRLQQALRPGHILLPPPPQGGAPDPVWEVGHQEPHLKETGHFAECEPPERAAENDVEGGPMGLRYELRGGTHLHHLVLLP